MDRPALAVYPAGAHMPTRELDDWELVWIIRGQATLTGTPRVQLPAGHVLLLPPGHAHGFDWNPRGFTEHGYVHFDLASVPDAPQALAPVGNTRGAVGPVHLAMTRDDPLAGLCAYLLWLGSAQLDAWQGPATAVIGQILHHMVTLPRPDVVAERLPGPVEKSVHHLRSAWSTAPLARIPVGELASSAAVSEVHLSRLFKATFDVSVAAGLEQLRCLRAATLLERTDLSTAQIARECGFSDASHFSHRFRTVTGVPPTAARVAGERLRLRDKPGLRPLEQQVLG